MMIWDRDSVSRDYLAMQALEEDPRRIRHGGSVYLYDHNDDTSHHNVIDYRYVPEASDLRDSTPSHRYRIDCETCYCCCTARTKTTMITDL